MLLWWHFFMLYEHWWHLHFALQKIYIIINFLVHKFMAFILWYTNIVGVITWLYLNVYNFHFFFSTFFFTDIEGIFTLLFQHWCKAELLFSSVGPLKLIHGHWLRSSSKMHYILAQYRFEGIFGFACVGFFQKVPLSTSFYPSTF